MRCISLGVTCHSSVLCPIGLSVSSGGVTREEKLSNHVLGVTLAHVVGVSTKGIPRTKDGSLDKGILSAVLFHAYLAYFGELCTQ